MKNFSLSLVTVFVALSLSACESTRETFDFSKKAPDEFSVTTRAPLEMPDDLNTLPPPRFGAPRPQENTATQQAREALFGQSKTVSTEITQGEVLLLEKTGAANVDANIRTIVDQETAELAEQETSTFNKILGRVGRKTEAPASVIDPVKESERLKEMSKTVN
jgi:hypothetical protein